MIVTRRMIQDAVRAMGLSGRPVCIHASLRSFGRVEGGADAVLAAFLNEECTVLVPSFTWNYVVEPPPHLRPPRNGWDYDRCEGGPRHDRVFTPAASDVDKDMGAIGKAAVLHPRRQRGNHSICSFSAVSPQARALVSRQGPRDVYAPLEALAQKKGAVLLLGVGLEAVTLIHLAEKRAGRVPFRRWAYDVAKRPTMVEVGSCSLGFSKFESCLGPTMTAATVGLSHWKCFDARTALDAATEAIRANPMITHCGRACARCDDAVAGGPIVPGGMPDGRAE